MRQREEAAFEALVTGLEHADPAWLDEKVSYGDSLERVIQDDGPEHYREHALDLRAWFTGTDEPRTPADDETDAPPSMRSRRIERRSPRAAGCWRSSTASVRPSLPHWMDYRSPRAARSSRAGTGATW